MTLDPRINAVRLDLADNALHDKVSASAYADGEKRRVILGIAPLKEAPDWEARLASETLFGEVVTVFDDKDGWSWVQAESDRYVGYMPSDCLDEMAPPSLSSKMATHRVNALHTFLYSQADLKSAPLDTLPLTADIVLTGEQDGDYVEVAGGGWIFKDHLSARDDIANDFIAQAERFIGTPYLWGGKSSRGIDCSGLVQVALRASGIAAMRDTDMQAETLGQLVDAPRQRGDIVYFPGHVGIMLDSQTLLHANAWSMTVSCDDISYVTNKISEKHDTPITCVRHIGN